MKKITARRTLLALVVALTLLLNLPMVSATSSTLTENNPSGNTSIEFSTQQYTQPPSYEITIPAEITANNYNETINGDPAGAVGYSSISCAIIDNANMLANYTINIKVGVTNSAGGGTLTLTGETDTQNSATYKLYSAGAGGSNLNQEITSLSSFHEFTNSNYTQDFDFAVVVPQSVIDILENKPIDTYKGGLTFTVSGGLTKSNP